MASNLLKAAANRSSPVARALSTSKCVASSVEGVTYDRNYPMEKIGEREVVGYGSGLNQSTYVDRMDYPFPAIRFKEFKGALQALREKEKGDWKNLTPEEKKELYRANFCQTYAEMKVNGKGNFIWCMGSTLILSAIVMWSYIWFEQYVINTDHGANPKTMSREWQEAATRRMIDQHSEPITGIASYWDYDKKQWKK